VPETIGQQEYFEGVSGLIPLYETWAKEWLNHAFYCKCLRKFPYEAGSAQDMPSGDSVAGLRESRRFDTKTGRHILFRQSRVPTL